MIFELDIRIGDKDKGRHAQIKIDDLTSASTKSYQYRLRGNLSQFQDSCLFSFDVLSKEL